MNSNASRLPSLTRRQILALAGSGLMTTILDERVATAAPAVQPPVVDTHLHCFAGPQDPRFPYHALAPYRPEAAATPECLLERMAGAGVDRAIVVHPEPYQDDHRYLEHCLEVGGARLKGTCLFFADRPDSLARMPDFLRRHSERVVAARLHAYAPDRLPPWDTPELDQLWRHATQAGIAMQLHLEPRYAPRVDAYVRRYPETRVVIDHLGRPMQGTPAEHKVILGWSELPNTIMKLSAIPPRDKYPHRDPAPIVRQLVELWGAERVIYGGGFSADATDASYAEYRQSIARMLPDCSAEQLAQIFGLNAMRLFGFTS